MPSPNFENEKTALIRKVLRDLNERDWPAYEIADWLSDVAFEWSERASQEEDREAA